MTPGCSVSENPKQLVWRDNVWYRHMKPKLDPLGLGWANFQALRRINASLGHEAGIAMRRCTS